MTTERKYVRIKDRTTDPLLLEVLPSIDAEEANHNHVAIISEAQNFVDEGWFIKATITICDVVIDLNLGGDTRLAVFFYNHCHSATPPALSDQGD